MKHLDLFSGIGGFALAAHRVGWETIGFCEIDPFCIRVLERWFSYHRWFSLPGHFSSGQAAGLVGLEELSSVRPDWLVIENVYHTWRRWMPELRRRLYERGYSSVPLRVSAADVGAVHLRARGWLVAHADSEPLRELSRWWSREGGQVAAELALAWDSAPRRLGTDDELPDWVDRRRALGNAIVPSAAELIFRGIDAVMPIPPADYLHNGDCPKVVHAEGVAYLHEPDDDSPYDVDGITYCGRCHEWLAR